MQCLYYPLFPIRFNTASTLNSWGYLMALAVEVPTTPDLGQLRGLSLATLNLCNVRAVGDTHAYGAGWLWDTYTLQGVKGTRWKSMYSLKPEGSTNWAKYRWYPEKPQDAPFYDPDGKLRAAVKDNAGLVIIVGGEIAAMSMFEAGRRNTTCFFGDNTVPKDTLLQDLSRIGATSVLMIPDRDKSGQECAVTVRDLLSINLDFDFGCLALPYPVEDKHGKDVNDLWLEQKAKGASFKAAFASLSAWHLPEPPPKVIEFSSFVTSDKELPPRFNEAILRDVESRGAPNKAFRWGSDGWSSNFRCPFHDDQQASAGFNRESMSFKCFACGKKSAKEYGESVGIHLRDFFDDPIPQVRPPPTDEPSTNGKHPEPIKIEPPVKQLLAPKLPFAAQLTAEQLREAERGRDWLDDYLNWTRQSCPLAPEIFHEAMALWLLATVSTRRMKLNIGGQEIYSNLYVLIVARTSVYRKSTAMNEAKKVLKQAGLECLLLPTDVTPEALFDELAGVKPTNFEALAQDDRRDWLLGRAVAAQRSFIKDECSSIFANLKKEYNAGLTELLLEGYQGDGGKLKKLLKSKGLISVRDMCLSFLGATTPVMYGKYITNEENENGFVARFAIVTPEGVPEYKIVDEPVPVPPALVGKLRRLFMDVLPWHNNERPSASASVGEVLTPPATTVTVDHDAMMALNAYRKALNYDLIVAEAIDDSKAAAYTRLGTMVLKVAMLLAAVDGDTGRVRIEPCHAYAAQQICERWRESLHRLDTDVAKSKNANKEDDRVFRLIKDVGEIGVSIRDIMRSCNMPKREQAVSALTVLADDGLIEKFEYRANGKGKPSIHYRLAQQNGT